MACQRAMAKALEQETPMDRKQLSGAANNLSVDFLRECFDYRDGVLYWKERPLRHFQRALD